MLRMRDLYFAILSLVDEESAHEEMIVKPSPEGGDGGKLQAIAKHPRPAEKQDKMVSEVRSGLGHGEHCRLCVRLWPSLRVRQSH